MKADFTLGPALARDPRRLAFASARYLFCAKMLAGMGLVAEIGAGDGILSAIVAQAVQSLILTDLEPSEGVQQHDILEAPLRLRVGGIYALDVLEHIAYGQQDRAIRHIVASLVPHGTCIIGMPSLESQRYAVGQSLTEHVGCLTEDDLRDLMRRHFHCVYMFGMHDTTLTTAFGPMCQYRLALCNTPK